MEDTKRVSYFNWDNKNWYYYSMPCGTINDLGKFEEILDWISEKVDMPYRHARWRINQDEDKLEVKFRYTRDYILFKLSF